MRTFDEVRKLASLPIRVVPLCLAGELVEEIAQLERQLADTKPPTSIGEASPQRIIVEQIADLREQMRESTVDFRLRAMTARAFTRFWASLPARGEKETGEDFSDRIFPFYADFIAQSCENPQMTVEQVGELVDLLHAKAWSDLLTAALNLNGRVVDIPNFEAASDLIGAFEQI